MNILSIRQPYASALLTGIYDAERRKFRLSGPTLIHAAALPGMRPPAMIEWLESRDPAAACAVAWGLGLRDDDPPESPLADAVIDSIAADGSVLIFGRIIGYVADWDPIREGVEWANHPIGAVHFPISSALPMHRGALGSLPCPNSVVDSVRAWIPQA
jgi:hypothetical protein